MPIRRSGLIVRDEGIMLPPVSDLDFQGAGVTVALSGSKLIATIPGATGGGSGMTAGDWVEMGIYRPQDFGTIDATGVADSRAAFQAALNELCSNSPYGGVLLVPQGRFQIAPESGTGNGLVTPQTPYDGAHGWGYRYGHTFASLARGACVLFAGAGLTKPVITFSTTTANLPTWNVENVLFQGLAGSTEVVRANELAYSTWKNVTVMGVYGGSPQPPIGLHFANCQINNFENIRVYNADTCILHDVGSGFTYGNNMNVYRNIVTAGSVTWGLDFVGGSHLVVDGIDCEGNSNYPSASGGVRVQAGSGPFHLRGAHWFEGEYAPNFDVAISSVSNSMSVIEGPASFVQAGPSVRVRGSSGKLLLRNLGSVGAVTADSGTEVIHEDTTSTFSGGGTKTTRH